MKVRSLSQRLKRLEARLVPAPEPRLIRVQFVAPDRRIVGGFAATIGAGVAASRRK